MRRIAARLFFTALFLGGGWVFYQLSDVTDCSGPRAETWFDNSVNRGLAANRDYETVDYSTSRSGFSRLAERAEDRYRSQLAQSGPACLDEMQEQMTDFFFDQWKMYEAAARGDFELAADYEEEVIRDINSMERQIDSVAQKYGWEE